LIKIKINLKYLINQIKLTKDIKERFSKAPFSKSVRNSN